jgi:hypothetical protein
MSYFEETYSCGAPRWHVDGFFLFLWVIGAMAVPLLLGAKTNAIEATWLIAPAILVIFAFLFARDHKFWILVGAFLSLCLGIEALAANLPLPPQT